MIMTFIGAVVPRLLLLVGWSNDQAYWQNAVGGPIWLLFGFLFFPCTTLVYGLASINGMSLLNWIFLLMGLLIDLSTWGIGALSARKQYQGFSGAE
jgi:hypothetical protein